MEKAQTQAYIEGNVGGEQRTAGHRKFQNVDLFITLMPNSEIH